MLYCHVYFRTICCSWDKGKESYGNKIKRKKNRKSDKGSPEEEHIMENFDLKQNKTESLPCLVQSQI